MEGYLTWALLFLALTLVCTAWVFYRKRGMDRGPRKGVAANPEKVRRQNPPDDVASPARDVPPPRHDVPPPRP